MGTNYIWTLYKQKFLYEWPSLLKRHQKERIYPSLTSGKFDLCEWLERDLKRTILLFEVKLIIKNWNIRAEYVKNASHDAALFAFFFF